MASWQKLSSKIVYDNPWITVFEDEVINPANKKTLYGHIASKNDAVGIVPIDNFGNTYVVLQERYTNNSTKWECPAGRINTNETVIAAAKRELLEETGLVAKNVEVMTIVDVANSMTSFKQTFCLARGVEKVTDQLDAVDGIIATKKVPLDQIYDMIVSGEIVCSTSIAALLLADKFINKE